MEKPMSFVLILPLEEMALRRVAINLWSETDILAAIDELQFKALPDNKDELTRRDLKEKRKHDRKLQESVEIKVKDKVSKLALPELLIKKIIHVVKPIGSEIIKWKLFHEEILYQSHEHLDVHILKQLHWTSTGAVDFQKTAELLRGEAFDVVKQYKLACLYCFIDSIPVLWHELPENYKAGLFEDHPSDFKLTRLENYWACVLKGVQSEIDYISARPSLRVNSIHHFAFEYSARLGYKAATVYFFQKLTKEERDSSLFKLACFIVALNEDSYLTYPIYPKENLSDILCYLLSQMTAQEQMQVLKTTSCAFLASFLYWPAQDFFLDMADLTWHILSESCYYRLLYCMNENIKYSGYYFPDLFQKFFLHSPNYFKKVFVDSECRLDSVFTQLFQAEDEVSIKVVFRNIDSEDKIKLVCSHNFLQLIDSHIKNDKWTLVELCLREVALSRDDKDRLKESLTEFFSQIESEKFREVSRAQWRRFFDFLDESDPSVVNKRNSEDGPQTTSKKLCSPEEKNLPSTN